MDGRQEPVLGLGLYRRGCVVRLVGYRRNCQALVATEADGGYVE